MVIQACCQLQSLATWSLFDSDSHLAIRGSLSQTEIFCGVPNVMCRGTCTIDLLQLLMAGYPGL